MRKMFRTIICSDPKPLEFTVGFQAFLWGLWLALPYNTFSSSTTYAVMNVLAPETLWGMYFATLGVVQIVAMHLFSRWARSAIAAMSMFSWIFIDLGFWVSGSTSAASVTYVTFALVSIWSVVALSTPDRVRCRDND